MVVVVVANTEVRFLAGQAPGGAGCRGAETGCAVLLLSLLLLLPLLLPLALMLLLLLM